MHKTSAMLLLAFLLAACGHEEPQVAKATVDEQRALDEAGSMIAEPGAPESAPPSGSPSGT